MPVSFAIDNEMGRINIKFTKAILIGDIKTNYHYYRDMVSLLAYNEVCRIFKDIDIQVNPPEDIEDTIIDT